MVGVWLLVVASAVGLLMSSDGAVESTVNECAVLAPVWPPLSSCVAWAEYAPSASAVPLVADHDVPERVAVSVCTAEPPCVTLKVTVAESPGASPAVPENAGVVSVVNEPSAGCERVTAGPLASTVKVTVALQPVFPALSGCDARTVYTPSASGPVGIADQRSSE